MRHGFVDTNVVIYALTQNHPAHSPRSMEFLEQLADGLRTATCANTVIFEAAYILRVTFGRSRAEVAHSLKPIIQIKALHFDHRQAILDALEFWADQGPLSFADCYHLALTRVLGLDAIYTFDKKMDRYPGVARVEPA